MSWLRSNQAVVRDLGREELSLVRRLTLFVISGGY
jgi:hypothetical protein